MNERSAIVLLSVFLYCLAINAEPNGAVLYLNGKRLGYHKVPSTAEHHYFGYLEGPAWENKYSSFRYYIDKDDRNAIDLSGKYKGEAILHLFSDTTVDEHKDWPWGSDILSIGSAIGLGAFRLYVNSTWVNPQLPENIDSLVVTISDSSVATPKIVIGYYGWNVANDGNKIDALWTISAKYDERQTRCELAISGTYTGKVVVGMVNHRENTNNPNRNGVTVIQENDPPLLATIGKQCDITENYADSLLMAIMTDKSYFDSFVKQGTTNLGMVLKPDAEKRVKWSFAYSWAKEENPLFRNPNWKQTLAGTTGICIGANGRDKLQRYPAVTTSDNSRECFSLSGQSIGTRSPASGARRQSARGLYIMREGDFTRVMIDGQ